MPEQKGIKETTELLVAMGSLAVVAAKAVKSGGSASDISTRIATQIVANPRLMLELKAAADNISEVPAEAKDLTVTESLELCTVALVITQKALSELKTAA